MYNRRHSAAESVEISKQTPMKKPVRHRSDDVHTIKARLHLSPYATAHHRLAFVLRAHDVDRQQTTPACGTRTSMDFQCDSIKYTIRALCWRKFNWNDFAWSFSLRGLDISLKATQYIHFLAYTIVYTEFRCSNQSYNRFGIWFSILIH